MKKKHNILIVDDEKENLFALKRTLHKLGTIHLASSGKQALTILKKEQISIIITDQRMPEMSGVSLLKKAYKEHPHTVRIMLTGYTDIENLIEAINAAHIYRYLTKPWNNEELKFIVGQAIERFELKYELDEKEEALVKANKFLEKKIEERTIDLKRLNSKLGKLAITDELTGIGNHRLFQNSFESELKRAKRYKRILSLLIIDVDHFKIYNDKNGHAKGDKLLKSIANILSESTREEDIVTRYGGEEFAIIAPETNHKKALELAERIRKECEKNTEITVSIGAATFPKHGTTEKQVFTKADKALYKSKKEGRNKVSVWNPAPKKAKNK